MALFAICRSFQSIQHQHYLVPPDYDFNILLQRNVFPCPVFQKGVELQLKDPDDGGGERHCASALANWGGCVITRINEMI